MFWLAYLAGVALSLFGHVHLLTIAFVHEKELHGWPNDMAWQKFLTMPRPVRRWHYLTVTLREAARAQGRSARWTAGMASLYLSFFGMIAVGVLQAVSWAG